MQQTELSAIGLPPADAAPQPPRPHLVIEPRQGWVGLDFAEIWRFKDLLLSLAGRDITLRYRQTALGVVWVVFQPLMAAGIFSFVFGFLAKLDFDGVPSFLLSFGGLIGFNAFSSTLTRASMCLVGNSQLISKVYFPRLVLPLSTMCSSLIDFAVGFAMLIVLLFLYHRPVGPQFLLLPVWLALLLMIALGAGFYTAALTVSYRDVQYILPVLVQFLLYGSPVAYLVNKKLAQLPPHLRELYFLNPLAALMQGLNWSMFGVEPPTLAHVAYSVGFSVLCLLIGAASFKRMERRFADVI